MNSLSSKLGINTGKSNTSLILAYVSALIILIGLGIAYISVRNSTFAQVFPYFSEELDYYFITADPQILDEDIADLGEIALLKKPLGEIQQILHDLTNIRYAQRIGVFSQNQQIYSFLQVRKGHQYRTGEDLIVADQGVLLNSYKIHIYPFDSYDLLLLTKDGQNPLFPEQVYSKQAYSLTSGQEYKAFSYFNGEQSKFFGITQKNQDLVTHRLVRGEIDTFAPLASLSIPDSPYYLVKTGEIEHIDLPKPFERGAITGITGTLANFIENPFQEEIEWIWEGAGSLDDVKEMILVYLSQEYPQAIETELPDGSSIFELQEVKDAFITSEEMTTTVLTYPKGQFVLEHISDYRVRVTRTEQELETEELRHSCVQQDALLYGQVLSPESGDELGKNIFFSYSSQEIVLCFNG